MAMTMAAPNLSQTTSSGTQSDFQTLSTTTTSTNGLVVKAEVGCMTMTMPNGSPVMNCISKDGSNVVGISNNFDASTITSSCVGPGGGGGINGTGSGIGIATITPAGLNTSTQQVIMPSNSVSTGTSTMGLEVRKSGIVMNGLPSPNSQAGVVGSSNFSCTTVSNCQQIQVGNSSLLPNMTVSCLSVLEFPVAFELLQFF